MKVISIKQPWASLIVYGYKEYEFRTWKTKYRGDILIHASKNIDKDNIDKYKHLNIESPTGCIIGSATITDCLEVTSKLERQLSIKNNLVYGQSKNRKGYAFYLTNPNLINKIYINGKLGIWNYEI